MSSPCNSESQDEPDAGEQAEESEEEVSALVDEDGRVCSAEGPLTRSMTFEPGARVFDAFLAASCLSPLRRCAEAAFQARPSKGRYSSGKTFWAEWGQEPRCELEALALAILHRHCPDPAASAGVEWWTLCLECDADVGWHWDRDYVLEDSGVNLHPMLGTVTYLSGEPPSGSSAEGQLCTFTLDVLSPTSRENGVPVALPAGKSVRALGLVVPPRAGRHLVFDGRFLHGAPRFPSRPTSENLDVRSGLRVTFLANIWVGHKPGNASSLPAELRWTEESQLSAGVLSPSPKPVQPKEVEPGSTSTSFPLEGGTLSVAPPEGAGGDVASYLAPVSWTQKKRRRKMPRLRPS